MDRWVRIVPVMLCICFAHEVTRGRLLLEGGRVAVGWYEGEEVVRGK